MQILPVIFSARGSEKHAAMLDVVFIWSHRQRGRTALSRLLRRPGAIHRFLRYLVAHLPGRKKKDFRGVFNKDVKQLTKVFEPRKALKPLNEHILKNYGPQQSLLLVDLVGRRLAPFHAWLAKYR